MAVDRRRALGLAAVWLGPSLVLVLLTWAVQAHYRIDTPSRLSAEARAQAIAPVRAALDGLEVTEPEHPELRRSLPDDGPVVVSIWLDGSMKARLTVPGETAAEALGEAARALPEHPNIAKLGPTARSRARIKIDVVVGRGPLLRKGDFLADATGGILELATGSAEEQTAEPGNGLTLEHVGMHPGIDGLGVTLGGDREVVLLPDELMRGGLLMAEQPLKFVPEFKLGLSFEVANKSLAGLAGLGETAFMNYERHYWRFHSDAFVEQAAGSREQPPVRLTRNMPPRPELTAENLREAALSGGRYLVAHLAENGRYIYEQNLSSGQATDPSKPGPYSIPRHAGTTYFLAELYRITGAEFLREPIERAFAHLEALLEKGGCTGTHEGAEFACVIDYNQALDNRITALERRLAAARDPTQKETLAQRLHEVQGYKRAGLGSTALAVVALAEHARATGSDTYMPLARKLTEWILYMQRDDGSFRHVYVVPRDEPVEDVTLLYFAGESALALARMHLVTGEERYRVAAKKAMDSLIGWYDFFVGGFIYGEEHWTCIAAEALWPAVKDPKYAEFCNGYAEFLRRQQFGPGDFPGQADLVGAYGVSPFVMPHNTPAGSRTEAMISTYLLGTYHGEPQPEIREQILEAMHYALGQQIRPESSWDVHPDARGIGAIPGSPTDRVVRIDYVQHVCSAIIRSIEVLERPGR